MAENSSVITIDVQGLNSLTDAVAKSNNLNKNAGQLKTINGSVSKSYVNVGKSLVSGTGILEGLNSVAQHHLSIIGKIGEKVKGVGGAWGGVGTAIKGASGLAALAIGGIVAAAAYGIKETEASMSRATSDLNQSRLTGMTLGQIRANRSVGEAYGYNQNASVKASMAKYDAAQGAQLQALGVSQATINKGNGQDISLEASRLLREKRKEFDANGQSGAFMAYANSLGLGSYINADTFNNNDKEVEKHREDIQSASKKLNQDPNIAKQLQALQANHDLLKEVRGNIKDGIVIKSGAAQLTEKYYQTQVNLLQGILTGVNALAGIRNPFQGDDNKTFKENGLDTSIGSIAATQTGLATAVFGGIGEDHSVFTKKASKLYNKFQDWLLPSLAKPKDKSEEHLGVIRQQLTKKTPYHPDSGKAYGKRNNGAPSNDIGTASRQTIH